MPSMLSMRWLASDGRSLATGMLIGGQPASSGSTCASKRFPHRRLGKPEDRSMQLTR